MKSFFAALTFLVGLAASAPLLKTAEKVENEYIVVFKNEVSTSQRGEHFNKVFYFQDAESYVTATYNTVLNGYAAKLSKEHLKAVLADPLVDYVEENGVVRAEGCNTQSNTPSWGLPRISVPAPVPGLTDYKYPTQAGEGVTAYIIDTGIYLEHNDLEGRARFGFQATGTGSNTDKNGHGTHVATTVGGKLYGVAKKANLVAVKVLGDNGSGSFAGVISGVDWVAANAGPKNSTANMSLGGGYSLAVNTAVNALFDTGVVLCVSAGNNNYDSSRNSPASAEKPITVGATAQGTPDIRSSFSNYGPGVDVYAPGTAITAGWIGNPDAKNTISGTSMATPHVTGIATVLISQGHTNIKDYIIKNAKSGLINMNCGTANTTCSQTPNRMAYLDPTC